MAVDRAATVDDKTAAAAAVPLRTRNPVEEGADGAAKPGEESIVGGEGVDAAVEEAGVAAGTGAASNMGAVVGIVAQIGLLLEVDAGAAAAIVEGGRSAARGRS